MNKKTIFLSSITLSCALIFFGSYKKEFVRFIRKTLSALDFGASNEIATNAISGVAALENKIQIQAAVIQIDDLKISADIVFLDYKTNDVEFVGNVLIKQDDMLLTGTQFFYDHKAGLLYSSLPVKFETSVAITTAQSVRFDKESKEIIFDQGVFTIINR